LNVTNPAHVELKQASVKGVKNVRYQEHACVLIEKARAGEAASIGIVPVSREFGAMLRSGQVAHTGRSGRGFEMPCSSQVNRTSLGRGYRSVIAKTKK
jgi:hypothetical protein